MSEGPRLRRPGPRGPAARSPRGRGLSSPLFLLVVCRLGGEARGAEGLRTRRPAAFLCAQPRGRRSSDGSLPGRPFRDSESGCWASAPYSAPVPCAPRSCRVRSPAQSRGRPPRTSLPGPKPRTHRPTDERFLQPPRRNPLVYSPLEEAASRPTRRRGFPRAHSPPEQNPLGRGRGIMRRCVCVRK